jgi:hypothetical protein
MKPCYSCICAVASLLLTSPATDAQKLDEVPLSSIYVTSEQKGLNHVVIGKDVRNMEAWREFLKARPQVSALLLRPGEKISDFTTKMPFGGGDVQRPLWLVVFFGFAPSRPPEWTIDSIERGPWKVRVNYHLATSAPAAKDVHVIPYFAWVPLGDPPAGKYALELADSRTREITLMRRFTVVAPE